MKYFSLYCFTLTLVPPSLGDSLNNGLIHSNAILSPTSLLKKNSLLKKKNLRQVQKKLFAETQTHRS